MIQGWAFTGEGKIVSHKAPIVMDAEPPYPMHLYSSKAIARSKRVEWLPPAIEVARGNIAALKKAMNNEKRRIRHLLKIHTNIEKHSILDNKPADQ